MPDINADLKNAPRCLHCDYVLIGLPEDRCPECGQVIDWTAIRAARRPGGLPLDTPGDRGLFVAGALTWLWVLVRPITFARRLSENSRLGRATMFAIVCMAVGIGGNATVGIDPAAEWPAVLGWAVGCWFHIELQSLVFLACDSRRQHVRRQWSFWRKVSLYTTAFVVLDWAAGPPIIEGYTEAGNFPWILDPPSWWLLVYWLALGPDRNELLRGVAYYWWMIVLTVVLCVRLRRKRTLLVILAVMPGVTYISWGVGMHVGLWLEHWWNTIVG